MANANEGAMVQADVAEVVNLVNLYAAAVDTQAWELLDQVFTADVVADFGGPAVFEGLAVLKETFAVIHEPFQATLHVMTIHCGRSGHLPQLRSWTLPPRRG